MPNIQTAHFDVEYGLRWTELKLNFDILTDELVLFHLLHANELYRTNKVLLWLYNPIAEIFECNRIIISQKVCNMLVCCTGPGPPRKAYDPWLRGKLSKISTNWHPIFSQTTQIDS